MTAEIPASTYGLLAGALALGWGLVRLGERALDKRANGKKERTASATPDLCAPCRLEVHDTKGGMDRLVKEVEKQTGVLVEIRDNTRDAKKPAPR